MFQIFSSFVFLSASQRCLSTLIGPLTRAPSCGIFLHIEHRTVANSLALFTQRFSTKFYRNLMSSLRFFHSCKNKNIPTFSLGFNNYWNIFSGEAGGGQATHRNFWLIICPFNYALALKVGRKPNKNVLMLSRVSGGGRIFLVSPRQNFLNPQGTKTLSQHFNKQGFFWKQVFSLGDLGILSNRAQTKCWKNCPKLNSTIAVILSHSHICKF